MQSIGAGLGFDVDLATRLGTVFRIVKRAADAILRNRVLRNLQPGLGFLSLLLNAAGINTVNLEVIIVARAAGEPNGSLIPATIILRKRCEHGEASPVAPIVGEVSDLLGVYDRRRLRGTAFRRSCGCLYLDFFRNRADFKLSIQRPRLSDLQYNVFYHPGLETFVGNRHRVAAYSQSGKAIVAPRIGPLFLSDASVGR